VANPGQLTISLSTGDAVEQELSVMFSPHAPAAIVRVVDDRLEVLVPEGSRTGPIAVVKKTPDFTSVKSLLAEYADQFPAEWAASIFAFVRMDTWAFPFAFGPPILEIIQVPNDGGTTPNHPVT
jgi:hypothetical protein